MEAWWVEPLGGTLELRAGASPALTWFPWLKCEKLIGVQAQHLAELLGVGLRVRGQNEYNITSSKADIGVCNVKFNQPNILKVLGASDPLVGDHRCQEGL